MNAGRRLTVVSLRRPDSTSLRPKEAPLGYADGAYAASLPLLRKTTVRRRR
ncbi:MAG: hypothetical protein AB2705_02015 [Candidatus Thiodiazotropha sp.]